MVFGWAQIIMDIQPLVVILTGEGHLHGFSHTLVGATLLAIFSALTGKWLSEWGLVFLGIAKKAMPVRISWWVVFTSAFIGTWSHVLLDAMMHSDVQPFFPINEENLFLGMISYSGIYQLCVYLGLIGAAIYFGIHIYNKRNNRQQGL